MKESDPTPLPDQPTLFEKFAQIIQEKDAKIDQLNEQLAKVHHQLKLATDKEVCHFKFVCHPNKKGQRDRMAIIWHDVSTLTVRIAELERRVPEMHFSFLSGKQVEMEEKVLELQKPLEEDTEKNQECKEKERSV